MAIDVNNLNSPTLNYQYINPIAAGKVVNPPSRIDGFYQVEVAGSSNLIASNVKSGVTIFDVTGSLRPNPTEYKFGVVVTNYS